MCLFGIWWSIEKWKFVFTVPKKGLVSDLTALFVGQPWNPTSLKKKWHILVLRKTDLILNTCTGYIQPSEASVYMYLKRKCTVHMTIFFLVFRCVWFVVFSLWKMYKYASSIYMKKLITIYKQKNRFANDIHDSLWM